jgi:hypothetical protein
LFFELELAQSLDAGIWQGSAPAGKPIVIVVRNLDPALAEFENNRLPVEKVVTGNGTLTMRIRPLEPGRYRFFEDFHPETQGYLVVK